MKQYQYQRQQVESHSRHQMEWHSLATVMVVRVVSVVYMRLL